MMLKAVLFNFNGIILNDQSIHQKLIEQILVEENLRPQPEDFQRFRLGQSDSSAETLGDRAYLQDLLTSRGRVVTEAYLEKLLIRKAQYYQQHLKTIGELPLSLGLEELILKLLSAQLKLAVISSALRMEVEAVLSQTQLAQYFPVIVAAEDVAVSQPKRDRHLLAIEGLNQKYPTLALTPANTLAIADTFAGIKAAKESGVLAVGVANIYPAHMLQRLATWTIDCLHELELDQIQAVFDRQLS